MLGELISQNTIKLMKKHVSKREEDAFWRKVYAGMAMQGFCANPHIFEWDDAEVAGWSASAANALLAALATEGKKGGE